MRVLLSLVIVLAACGGGDSTGPGPVNHAGTYHGQFYGIATSSSPAQRDSLNGGAVTITLAATGGQSYDLSTTSSSGGSSAPVTINNAGVIAFPAFDEAEALDLVGSLLAGVCDVSNANGTPSGVVAGGRVTVNFLASGVICDWGVNDLRATLIQLTWTGT